jgi:hypothetical protein
MWDNKKSNVGEMVTVSSCPRSSERPTCENIGSFMEHDDCWASDKATLRPSMAKETLGVEAGRGGGTSPNDSEGVAGEEVMEPKRNTPDPT